MKFKLLALLFISVIQLEAQTEFVSFSDCKKTTEYIALDKPEHIEKFIKKSKKYVNCVGLKLDTRLMTKQSITDFLIFLQTQTEIKTLELRYSSMDSIDFNALTNLTELESLGLQNTNCNYPSKDQLSGLKKLYKLTLYINQLNQIPSTIYQLNTMGELELCSETMPTKDPSYLYFNYALNDSLDNAIEINSYCENIDLSIDSMKKEFFALWPKAEERKSTLFTGGNIPNRDMFKSPNPATLYQPIAALQPINKTAPISFENQSINPCTENQLVFKDHTVLTIPPDAFVTQSGKLIEGDVKILYRSIRTPLDIMQSGITMFYDTAGQTELFKTNGMFEVRAFANNEELKLAANKSIGVDFATKKDSTNFNLYALNDKTGKWQYKKPIIKPSPNQPYIFNCSTMKDKTSFADRYSDLTYNNVLPDGRNGRVSVPVLSLRRHYNYQYFSLGSSTKSGKIIREGRSQIRLKINYETSNNKQKKVFFYLFSPYIKSNINPIILFPELKPFDGFVFEYDGEITTSEFNKQFKKGKVYNDIRIYYENKEETAIIELKTKTEYIQIRVKAYLTNALGKTRPNNGFKRAYRKYIQLVNIKEIKFNQTLDKTFNRYEKIDTNFYNVYSAMSGKNINTSAYQLNVDVLGIFNCDQLYRIDNPIQLMASQFKCNGQTIDSMESVYVVDLEAQGTYTFNPSTIILSFKNVGGLIFQNQNGAIFTCTGESLRAQINQNQQYQKSTVISVEKVPLKKAEDMVKAME